MPDEHPEPGILKILFDRGRLAEFERLCDVGDKAKLTQALVNRIHEKDKELMRWFSKETGITLWERLVRYEGKVYHFRNKKLAINSDSEVAQNGKRIESLHNTVLKTTIQRKKLLLEYNIVLKEMIDDIKALKDDGGERE
ncbi:MAG: hypothetical protein ACXADO_00720 [Candidatus Thorarchaeota archaeon]